MRRAPGTNAALLALLALVALAGCERQGGVDTTPERDPDRAEAGAAIVSRPVAGNVHVLMGKGGNIGVSVGDDGVLIIDDKFAESAPAIKKAIADLHPGKIAFVLNTHHHGDHTGGNPTFGAEGTIIAHENVRKHLVEQDMAAAGLPVITFDDRMKVYFNGEEIRIHHLPHGHTDGDSVILFTKSNVLHTGDHFFNGRFPFVDIDGGGNPVMLARNVGTLIEELPEGVRIIPGHGDVGGKEDLVRFHRMLTETIAAVKKYKDAGDTLDDAKKKGLPAEWASWGEGFVDQDKWIEILWRGLELKADAG